MEWDARFGHNMRLFLSNYSAIVICVMLLVVVTQPLILLGLTLACGVWWLLSSYLTSNAVAVNVAGQRLTSAHLNTLFTALLFLGMLTVFGTSIFFFIGLSTTLVAVHALFRNDKQHNLGTAKTAEEAPGAMPPSPA